MTKPFLKWAGGKRQLLPEIMSLMPQRFNHYFEPFIGGGAVFFHSQPQSAFISDVNEELINCYKIVRDKPHELIASLGKHPYQADYFYELRNLDRDEAAFSQLDDVARASRLIYLNRSGFNGMYRVNKKGHFNVPFGRYVNPKIVNEPLILEASNALQGAQIDIAPYDIALNKAKAGDLVYLDPPYMPVSKTASFTSYAKDDFGLEKQQELADYCRFLDKNQILFIASNAYLPPIKALYEGFQQKEIKARRAINSRADKRQPVSEILIWNF